MTNGREKSDSAILATKPANNAGETGCGVGGAKGGDQGEHGSAIHAPGAEPGSRVKRRTRTSSGKGAKEGEVHRAAPPC